MPLVDDKTRRQIQGLRKLLEHPENMRLCVYLCGLAIGFFAIYQPLSSQIEVAERRLEFDGKRADMAQETDGFRSQVMLFEHRLYSTRDTNEWVQYILTGTRTCGLRFRKYDPGSPFQAGPYEVLNFTFELGGSYNNIIRFIQWIEQNERLFRIEGMLMEQLPSGVSLKITILGLGTRAATKAAGKSSGPGGGS